MILAEPDPDSLVNAVERALARVHEIDREEQHQRVSQMYSWWTVCRRTEAVYDEVAAIDDELLLQRFNRHMKCGPIAGIVFTFLAMMYYLVARFMEWCRPSYGIEIAPDIVFDKEQES